MVSLSTEICQNFNRFSLPSLYHKERTILIIFFFLFLFSAVHRIIFTDILQLLFYEWKLKCVLFLGFGSLEAKAPKHFVEIMY